MKAGCKTYDFAIRAVNDALSKIEGQTWGPLFVFTSFHDGLHHSCEGGWRRCPDFDPNYLPNLGQFAADLNAATAPVRKAYAEKLRQHLVNECVLLAAKALTPEPTP